MSFVRAKLACTNRRHRAEGRRTIGMMWRRDGKWFSVRDAAVCRNGMALGDDF